MSTSENEVVQISSANGTDIIAQPATTLHILVNPLQPAIDIVAVHGLNPFGTPSHAEDTWAVGEKLWIRDFLPKRIRNARIFLYQYNASVSFETAATSIEGHAENLLNQLHGHRTEALERPMLFIGHSLGGLVIKQALVNSRNDITYEMIGKSAFGVVFFGTPHNGGHYARLGDAMATVFRRLSRNPNNDLMKALKKDSKYLVDLNNKFRHFYEDLRFLSFYETRPLGYLGIIVERESAVLGLSGIRETILGLEADHASICKFSRDDDPIYLQVSTNIVLMVENFFLKQKASLLSRPRGNIAVIVGHRNNMIQIGYGNQATEGGDENALLQVGDEHEYRNGWDGNDWVGQVGTGNNTTQLNPGNRPIEYWILLLERLRQFSRRSPAEPEEP